MSSGGCAFTTGLGLYSHSSELCSRCSSSRTEVKYWSIRCWSAFESERFSRFDLLADEVEHAAALAQRLDIRRDFVRLALHEQLLEQLLRAALGGDRRAAAGEAERLAPSLLIARTSDG